MKLRHEIVRLPLLIVLVVTIWCKVYHRYSIRDWRVPTSYAGDSLFFMAFAKAASDGEFLPVVSKTNKFLGAPFGANWNDYPLSEDLMLWITGMFARLIGLGAAINLSFLTASVLAAVCFYLVGRYLRWKWEWCLMGAIVFAFSNFAFFRNIWHINYTHYWHLPLCLLVCWFAGSSTGLTFRDRRYRFALAVALITGFLSVYYTNFFLQFLILATLSQVVRRSPWPKILAPITVIGTTIGAFLLMNLDTLCYSFKNGFNPHGVVRSFANLEFHALHPIELFIPRVHQWSVFEKLTQHYLGSIQQNYPINEPTYLGIVGAIGLTLMLITAAISLMRRPIRPAFAPAWQAVWLIGYSVIGGLNAFVGLAGFVYFRAASRATIMILALSLFFLVRTLSDLTRRWPSILRLALSVCIIALALADQVPYRATKKDINQARQQMEADRAFVKEMEARLRSGAMVFQLPVTGFPEVGPRVRMGDYESLRLYLFSHHLRFSHGTCKGRQWDSWQRDVESLPVPELVETLEQYGFAAICINQRAYADNGAQWIEGFRREGREQIIQNKTNELTCVFLQPGSNPVLPELLTDFHDGWNASETNAQGISSCWSKGNATVRLVNLSNKTLVRYLSFNVGSPRARKVVARIGKEKLWDSQIATGSWVNAHDLLLKLAPGNTQLQFETDIPAFRAGHQDPRIVAFAVSNFKLRKNPALPGGNSESL